MKVDTAYTGKDSILLAKKNKYDLILMDIEMDVCNGFEATKEIRSYEEET